MDLYCQARIDTMSLQSDINGERMLSNSAKCVLAIDLGTGGPKVALVSNRGNVLAHATKDIPVRFLPGGVAENDPREWWNAIVGLARKCISDSNISVDDVVSVSCTTQWSVTVPVDKDGEPVMNAVSWMDTRGAKYCRALSDGLIKVQGYDIFKLLRWIRLTGGCPTHSGADSLAHVLFIKNELPEIYRKTFKFLEPMDYFNFRLTGKFAATSGTMFAMWLTDNRNLNKAVYDDGLLRLTGIDREKLPELLPPDTILGTLTPKAAEELGLRQDTKVVMGTGDNHSATMGSGAVRDFEAHCYIGTTSWFSCHVPFKKTDIGHLITTLPAAMPGRNLVLAQQGTGGECFKFLKDNILFAKDELDIAEPHDSLEKMNALAASAPPGSRGVLFSPFLTGALTPVDDRHTHASFMNLTLKTTRAHLVRAVMEGVAYNLRWLLPHFKKFIGHDLKVLNFIGGGAQSDVWSQILADVLDCEIRQMASPRQANVRGAAFTAMMALGLVNRDEIGSLAPVAHTYTPNSANRAIYDKMFAEFVAVYNRNKSIYRRLNPDT
jgi:xylulokinase